MNENYNAFSKIVDLINKDVDGLGNSAIPYLISIWIADFMKNVCFMKEYYFDKDSSPNQNLIQHIEVMHQILKQNLVLKGSENGQTIH